MDFFKLLSDARSPLPPKNHESSPTCQIKVFFYLMILPPLYFLLQAPHIFPVLVLYNYMYHSTPQPSPPPLLSLIPQSPPNFLIHLFIETRKVNIHHLFILDSCYPLLSPPSLNIKASFMIPLLFVIQLLGTLLFHIHTSIFSYTTALHFVFSLFVFKATMDNHLHTLNQLYLLFLVHTSKFSTFTVPLKACFLPHTNADFKTQTHPFGSFYNKLSLFIAPLLPSPFLPSTKPLILTFQDYFALIKMYNPYGYHNQLRPLMHQGTCNLKYFHLQPLVLSITSPGFLHPCYEINPLRRSCQLVCCHHQAYKIKPLRWV